MGKGGNAGNQHFLLSPQCFQESSQSGLLRFAIVWQWINSLPNDKILDRSKLKAFADNKINMNEKLKFVLETVENVVGKGENAG